ncbi:MAG: hypothetical protein A2Y12_01055 [Planctomycetes bacterium GWF2_42_9]|nr:MAG: hypothetical protein A2Y12_01055 [Planctomycetes bacterium GWF2_42_9]
MQSIRYLSVCGMLGYGYPIDNLTCCENQGFNFIGADNGSTDPGPYYLGSGKGFVKPMQIARDLEPALVNARKLNIPLIIGSAGGGGALPHVEAFLKILKEIAIRRDLHFRLAVISADIDKSTVLNALSKNEISPCGPVPMLTQETIEHSVNIVGQMGTDPFIEALEAGADVIIAGRSCDTAIFSAYPIWKGFDPGLTLHAAKIAECGALCAVPAGANDSLSVILNKDNFVVEPTNPARRCTPESVAAHSMYEQPDPNCFYEPEGKIDMQQSKFVINGQRGVKVSGTRLVSPEKKTIKLEAARLKGYRTITLAGLRDPYAILHLKDIEAGVREKVVQNTQGIIDPAKYSLNFLRYGLDGVTGERELLPQPLPREVGIVIEVIAPTQELADMLLSLARSTALHQPFEGRKTTAGNLAFPFSPSDMSCGAVYEFSIYHLMEVETNRLFHVNIEEV